MVDTDASRCSLHGNCDDVLLHGGPGRIADSCCQRQWDAVTSLSPLIRCDGAGSRMVCVALAGAEAGSGQAAAMEAATARNQCELQAPTIMLKTTLSTSVLQNRTTSMDRVSALADSQKLSRYLYHTLQQEQGRNGVAVRHAVPGHDCIAGAASWLPAPGVTQGSSGVLPDTHGRFIITRLTSGDEPKATYMMICTPM